VRLGTLHGQAMSVQEHVVQFFDSDETRIESAAGFLAEGYRNGSHVIIIARPSHSSAILNRLAPVDARRVVVFDARETLDRISRNGSPDPGLFDDVFGRTVSGLGRQRRVHAYGEMVDVLAQRDDFVDAHRLEELWNRLGPAPPMSLMCGYAAAHFVPAGNHAALREICAAHSAVHADPQDPLAAWLLARAHQ